MYAIICRRKLLWVPPKDSIFFCPQFFAAQHAVFVKSFSRKSSSDVCRDERSQSFTVSYLINSCGLSSKDALDASKKVCIKSPEKPDAVLKLLRKYGFNNSCISRLVTRWPKVLSACPEKILLRKLEFFRSIGVPLAVLAQNLSIYPLILQRSLENYLIPSYNFFKSVVRSDKRVVIMFSRSPRAFASGWQREISSNIAILRERGLPESSIVSLIVNNPSIMITGTDKFAGYVDRAGEMGFDRSKIIFVHAIEVFADMSESTLKHKMDVYRRCGWSESDITCAFSKHPLCMKLSEKKITDNMDFLVNKLGCKPFFVAERPVLLGLNLDKRMKPRWLVARILHAKGSLEKNISVGTFLKMSEEKFLKRYIVNYQEDIPELLDIYQGKLRLPDMDFSQETALFKNVC